MALVAMMLLGGSPAAAQVYNCLPSCDTTDARFLAISGSNLINLSENKLNLTVSVPAGTTSFQLGVFDGDAGALDLLNVSHWDTGVLAVYEYTLYADPGANSTGTTAVDLAPGSPVVLSSAMADNAWTDFTITTSPAAQTPSGNYFYRLNIRLLSPALTTTNAFKLRSDAVVSGTTINPVAQPFSYIANLRGAADLQIVYPSFPAATPTRYDGTFPLYFDLPVTQQELVLWDGDFDRGKFDGTDLDTDDPDTPNSLPPWATPSAVPEGVGIGLVGTTGNPPDDRNPAGSGIYNSKPPSVRYEVIFPDGQIFVNSNPSGNSEWEQFRISTDPFDRSQMDHHADSIPAGIYQFRGIGVDMQNLNALLLPSRVLCVSQAGEPCIPLRPFLIGDTVFIDDNGNGTQDPGELGIAGVILELLDEAGAVLETTTTDADGHYSFGAEAYTYTVRVADENFQAEFDGVLVNFQNTTPEQCTAPVVDDNVDNCDFGYQGRGSIGNRVWNDFNGNGVQDVGEPGLNGVMVELVDPNDETNVLEVTTTDGDGNYEFVDVDAGTYVVRVDPFTLSNGAIPTFDLDGVVTPGTTLVTLASGEHRLDVDFGYRGDASIGDRVWYDNDGDGFQDTGEPGVNGVTVELVDFYGDAVVGTTVTSGDGNYAFTNLFESRYTVRIVTATLPPGVTQTFDADGLGSPDAATLDLFAGETRNEIDFGYRSAAAGSIGDRVWNDANGNAIQDTGEVGLNGVTVELLDAGNNVVATATTSGDGNYTFNNLAAGTYTVRTSTLPAGVAPTFDADGIATPNVATVSLADGQNRDTVDFGYRGTASVGDRVWFDANGDGVQGAGETGINGVIVELLDAASNVVGTATTSGDGNYTFSFLMGGSYSVRVVPASLPSGVAQTYDLDGVGTPHVASFTLAGGQNRTDVDFGYRGTGSVGDRLWLDTDGDGVQDAGEAGINGATVQVFDGGGNLIATTSTAGDGVYGFSNLGAGTYTVKVVPSTLPAGVNATYDLDGVGTLNEATFTLGAGASRDDVDFGYRGTASVGDRVWNDTDGDGVQDAGEAGINGVTVELLDSANNVIATTTTSGDGDYTFNYLLGGSYSVRVVPATLPAGLAPTYDLDGIGTAHVASFTLNAGQNRTDVDFGYRGTASVGDRVWYDADGDGVQDAGEAGINGVTVELLDNANNVVATTTTAGDGNYTFSNLGAGSYSVRVTPPAGTAQTYDLDGVASANIASFTLTAGQNRTDVDFGYRGTASVGDRVWYDADGDGVQDAGEAGINGVTVELLDNANNVIATTTTAGDGSYTFSNLDAGSYSVRVTPPAGTAPTYDLDGVGTANVASFSLTAGQSRTDVDFGYRGTASAGDRVWNDADGDGVQDAGEVGINGLTVELLDNANNVIATTTTTGDGNYTFNNLNAGSYSVRVTPPAGTAPTYDLDGIGTANVASFSLTAGQSRTDVDFGYRGTASVGDRLWIDGNGNGVQDVGEAGINGVTVELLDAANNVVASTTTAGDGLYGFANLSAGNYSVRVVAATLPAGLAPTYDLDGVGTPNIASFSLAAGANRTDVDFGYRGNASVGDRIWNDADGDGTQDAGEAGINGVTVELLDAANNVMATTVTAGDGIYGFGNLLGGNYTVRVVSSTLPAGFAQTYDLDGLATPHQASFSLAAGASRNDVDFGYRATASIGDRVWTDHDGDGVQDAGEAGINGVTVQLLDAASNVIATTTTAGDGNYTFGGLTSGTYTVRVVSATLPDGFTQTYDLDGVGTAHQATVTLGTTNRTDVDFGYRPDGDCVVKADLEPLGADLGGHDFYLPGIGTDFIFTPAPGGYTVNPDGTAHLTGTIRSVANPANAFTVDVQLSGFTTDVPAGSPKKEFAASSYIENGGPIDPAGWWYYTAFTGTLTGIGNYAGAVIDIVRTGPAFQVGYGANNKNSHYGVSAWFLWTVTQQPASGSLQANGQGDINSDLVDCPPATASVGDRVWNDADGDGVQDAGEAGINGATVELLDTYGNVIATTTTSGDGNYGFASLLAGNYSVRVTAPAGTAPTYDLDGVGTANVASFTLTTGQARTDADFGYRGTASVGDRVWNDADGDGVQDAGEAGINGVTVELLDGANNVLATTTTAGDGNYTFGNLNAGNYKVRVTPPAGVAPTYDLDGVGTANIASFSLTAGQTRTDVDFGYRGTASVGDRVWNDADGDGVQDAGEAGINGVTVELLDGANNVLATTTTAGDGNYTFANLNAGNYKVRVTPPAGVAPTYDLDGVGTANIASFSLTAGQTRTDVDFGYRGTASVGDRVWNDTDGDGLQGAGEAGINGVTVQLLNSGGTVIATTTTAGDGNYTFSNLNAGSYSVRVTPPAGVAQTYDLDGVATANVAAFTLTAGQARTDVDFGYRGTASVGDRVWNDADGDGVQDAGETGINGVTVQLLNSGGTVIATTTTSGDGNYTFSNLSAGSYSVRVTPPAGVAQTYDLDSVGTANVAAFTLTAGQARTDVDFGYRGTASVGDRVWNDADGDGVQDAGETGINGVTVQLLNSGGTVIATTTTSGDGNYTFSNLTAGNYSVRVTAPAGYAQTYDLDGVGTANIAAFTLTAGQARTDVDFGYRGNLSVGDRVWNDADGDGIQDATETGLNGITVQLLNSGGTVIATAITAGNGNYTFTNLALGNYSVRVVSSSLPAGYTQTFDLDGVATAHTASFSLTASRTDVDFGYKAAPVCTPGTFKDTFTSASFSNNEGTLSWTGSWVEVDSAGTGVSTGNVRVGTPVSGYLILNDYPDTGTQPSAARQMNLSGFTSATLTVDYHIRGVDTADAAVIEISKDGGANYTVLETLTGLTGNLVDSETYDISAYISSNTRIRFRISANYGGDDEFFKVDQVRVDAGCGPNATYSVGDRVWSDTDGDGVQDASETGISNVTVQLVNSSNAVIATDVTDSNGIYGFTNLVAGSYTVRVVSSSLPSGYTQTYDLDGIATAHQATFSLSANRTDVDFGYKPPVACAAGTFKDTFTSASFSNNEGTRTWAGAWVESDTAGVGVSSGNVTVGTPVSGYMILRDSPDTGTQPSAARQMNLTGFAGATLTVDFHIRGVEADDAAVIEVSKDGGANYTVLETLTGYSGTYISSRTYNISAYIASNTRIRFRISNNYGGDDDFFKVDQVKVDASCTPPTPVTYSVGDRVWKDTDGDGIQDSGETGISGVTVQLLNSGGTVIATDVTDSDGIYGFTNLAAGTYSVKVVSSTLPTGYTPTYDLDGVATPHIVTGPLTENHSDVDFGYKPPAACTASGTFKDTFTSASFSNNEGTLSWAGAWIESDTAGTGVSSGNVTVGTPVSGYMILRDSPDTGTQPSAARQMNLTGYAGATLTVNYHIRGVEADDAAVIEVSKDGGAIYTVLETFTGLTGDSVGTRTYNITSYIASNTRIRFRISANYGATDDYFKVDQVQVSASCTPPAATYSVGDLVWKDLDRDGVFDSGEPGISDATVQLLNSSGTVIATDITDSNGIYGFSNLAAGTYTVKVISSTLPTGLTPSYDLDGVSSAHQATFSLSANRTDVDFGYKSPFSNPGTGTIGYWKNHPEAWPVQSITLGNQTYTKAQAITLLGTASSGDKSMDLAKQLIGAKLNVIIDNDSTCIASTITAADNWLRTYPVGSNVSGSSTAWQTGSPLHTTLDDYNNGELCAPHRG
ncbi:MAG TPA: SdrD B-like domain-containing protein [Thermoanaerobaculia bacterium]|nr:SdrD B-like domain-containing protein [Thermoanaerobaculia bacterium]